MSSEGHCSLRLMVKKERPKRDCGGRQTDTTALNPVIFSKAEGSQIHLNVGTALLSSRKSTDTNRNIQSERNLQRACACLPQPQF